MSANTPRSECWIIIVSKEQPGYDNEWESIQNVRLICRNITQAVKYFNHATHHVFCLHFTEAKALSIRLKEEGIYHRCFQKTPPKLLWSCSDVLTCINRCKKVSGKVLDELQTNDFAGCACAVGTVRHKLAAPENLSIESLIETNFFELTI